MALDRTRDLVDVAMFIDWENMHGYLRDKANISALREVAEGYGRLVLAKAYADWRESRFQRDSQVLYQIGFEPVYVPSGNKNNVDVKLATDCIDCAYRHSNIGIFILVSGDGDFLHVVSTLRPLGKRVVVVAQSNNASARLGDLVDTLLIYDKDVEPVEKMQLLEREQPVKTTAQGDLRKVFEEIEDIIRQGDGAPILLTEVKGRLIDRHGKFDQRKYGFEKFKAMMLEGAANGHFSLHTAGLRDWLTLPQDDRQVAQLEMPDELRDWLSLRQGDGQITYMKMPDELDDVFREIVEIIKASKRKEALLAYIKIALRRKYGGFDESVYGYSQFKQLMQEGEELGYFWLGIDENQAHYAMLAGNARGDQADAPIDWE